MSRVEIAEPFFVAKALKWYKRPEVQQAIQENCVSREVAPRFGQGFGKRPDALYYPGDVLAFAKRRATSFHCSEERWRDPLQVQTGAPRREMDGLRIGWDLVLDIDCPYWRFSRLTAALFIRALQMHGINSISVKFSGNKGFHIGVPFEAFPTEWDGRQTSDLFPEAPRALATYLLNFIEEELISVRDNVITFDAGRKYEVGYQKLKELTGKNAAELVKQVTKSGRTVASVETGTTVYLCTSCGHTHRHPELEEYRKCDRCGSIMEPQPATTTQEETHPRFNVSAIVEFDTVLLASRHMYRSPYSLHEKSGLVSVVIDPDTVMAFRKESAEPEKIKSFLPFLDGSKALAAEGAELLAKAMASVRSEQRSERRDVLVPDEAIPEELFPPCMQLILKGMKDGRKRGMFALTNFLRSCGWGKDQIEARLEEWNKANEEALREVEIKGHVRYHTGRKEVVLPPNCKSFYQDLGVCKPDGLCQYIKNPAQYAKRRAEMAEQGEGGEPRSVHRSRLTEEQKEMRRKHRERMKSQGS